MIFLRDLDNLPAAVEGGAVTIGNFDGVHLGHARLLERLLAAARRAAGPAVVFTFDPHPLRILRPEQAPTPLTWTERKAELLGELGADAVIAYPTDRELLGLDAEAFFDRILCQRLRARAIVEGPDFRFGRGRRGDLELLGRLTGQAGMELDVVEPVATGGQMVSSSLVRQRIAQGDVVRARAMLTQPYRVRGMVVHGAGRGRDLGFPTANLASTDTLLPAEGIYAGRAYVDGRHWPAAMSLGPNPTFGEGGLKVEVHLIGFQGDLYDRPIEVDFLAHLRQIERFSSVDELLRVMNQDIAAARRIVASAHS